MTEEAQCLCCLLYLVACKSVLFFMVFYSANVGSSMVPSAISLATRVFVI